VSPEKLGYPYNKVLPNFKPFLLKIDV